MKDCWFKNKKVGVRNREDQRVSSISTQAIVGKFAINSVWWLHNG